MTRSNASPLPSPFTALALDDLPRAQLDTSPPALLELLAHAERLRRQNGYRFSPWSRPWSTSGQKTAIARISLCGRYFVRLDTDRVVKREAFSRDWHGFDYWARLPGRERFGRLRADTLDEAKSELDHCLTSGEWGLSPFSDPKERAVLEPPTDRSLDAVTRFCILRWGPRTDSTGNIQQIL